MKKFNGSLTRMARLGLMVSSSVLGMVSVGSVHASATAGLLDVYQMALMNDSELAAAQFQYQANQQGITTARAALLPQVKADGGYNVADSSVDSADVNTRVLSLTLNQALYSHDSWARYEQSKYKMEAAEYTFKTAQQKLILTVTESYFNVLLAEENLKLFKAKEEADKNQLERAEASAEVGLASRVDVLQAKSSYDLSKSDRINGENSVDQAYEALMKLTGEPLTALKVLPSSSDLPVVTMNLVEVEAKAESNNLSVKEASANLQSAQKEIDVQKSGYWPTVGFEAKYTDAAYSGYKTTPLNNFRDRDTTSFGVNATWALYSGGATDSQVSAARFQSNAEQQSLRNFREMARLDARVQVRTLKRGEDLVDALREAVKSNDAFLEAAEEGYRVGLKSLLEVLTARTNQYNARNNLLEAIHAQVLTNLKLESTLGDLTVDDLMVFDRLLQEPVAMAKPEA